MPTKKKPAAKTAPKKKPVAKKAAPAKKSPSTKPSTSPVPTSGPRSKTGAKNTASPNRARNKLSEKGIRRLDTRHGLQKQTHGFQVCVNVGCAPHTKLFSDSTHGGTSAALNAARVYRDSVVHHMTGGKA